jgi:hypothetical protein
MGREDNRKGHLSVEKPIPMLRKALAPQKNILDTKKSSIPMQIFWPCKSVKKAARKEKMRTNSIRLRSASRTFGLCAVKSFG